MPNVRIPAKISIEALRKELGDRRTEEILLAVYGKRIKLNDDLPRVNLKVARTVHGLLTEKVPVPPQLLPAIIRRYFVSNRRAATNFRKWIQEEFLEAVESGPDPAKVGEGEERKATRCPRCKKLKDLKAFYLRGDGSPRKPCRQCIKEIRVEEKAKLNAKRGEQHIAVAAPTLETPTGQA